VDKSIVVLAGLLALTGVGCGRAVSVENANSVIQVCRTHVRDIRKEFGNPDQIGMVAGLVTNEWMSRDRRMIVAFVNDIAVDVAVVSSGTTIELKNRCAK
jgi:hypothetical protein